MSEKKPVRYGIIGFGGIAENRIAKEGFALDTKRFPNGDLPMILTAATDINPARREAAEGLGLKWFESTEELLASGDVDAVFIATSNSTHFAAAKAAMEAHKHVIIEKPIATDLEEARHLQQLARSEGLSLSVDHMMTRNAYNIRCRELIAGGRIGTVDHIVLHMEFLYGSTPGEAASWRCADPKELGGPIGDVGTHCLYMAEFLLDSPVSEIQCVYTPPTLNIAVENGAIIRFTLKNGITGTARVAFNQPAGGVVSTLSNLGYEVYGENGTLRNRGSLFQLSGHQDEIIKQELRLDSVSSAGPTDAEITSEVIAVGNCENIYQAQIAHHARSIQEGRPLDGSPAVRSLQMVLACHESAGNNGSRQEINLSDSNKGGN